MTLKVLLLLKYSILGYYSHRVLLISKISFVINQIKLNLLLLW